MTSQDQDQHRRNLILDRDLVLRVMDWHGGMSTKTYSLGSCGLNDYVSVSMVQACIDELEQSLETWKTREDLKTQTKDIQELEDLIGELDMIVSCPHEHTTLEVTGEDEDSGYATWLQEDEDPCDEDRILEYYWYGTVDGEAFDGDLEDIL